MSERVEVLKTYKLYIGGKFSRTESGRYFKGLDAKGNQLANLCRASRKDLRNAVVAADKAQSAWWERSDYNRGQILYRMAENLESRKAEFSELLQKESGLKPSEAKRSVEQAIDDLVYFAGWCDKYQAVFSSVNPVASAHFNFSIVEPMGVVSAICEDDISFNEMVILMASTICGGNALVVLAPKQISVVAQSFAEVLHHSDLPGGVVNILSGFVDELLEHMAGHMEIKGMAYLAKKEDQATKAKVQELGSENMKRLSFWSGDFANEKRSPFAIEEFMEVKTTWHPIEQIGGAAAAY
jgi:acyl-CoA reductase-like NAD-dependent aldehyde dehydrogenase